MGSLPGRIYLVLGEGDGLFTRHPFYDVVRVRYYLNTSLNMRRLHFKSVMLSVTNNRLISVY